MSSTKNWVVGLVALMCLMCFWILAITDPLGGLMVAYNLEPELSMRTVYGISYGLGGIDVRVSDILVSVCAFLTLCALMVSRIKEEE